MAASINRNSNLPAYIDGASVSTMNVTTLQYPGDLGKIWSKNGITYQLVLVKSTSSAVAAGTPLMWQDYDDFVVSAKVSDAARAQPAGVGLGTITAGNYGIIQVGGPCTTMISTGAITAGDTVVMSATDGTSITGGGAGTASIYPPFGPCTVTAASNVVGVQINLPLNF